MSNIKMQSELCIHVLEKLHGGRKGDRLAAKFIVLRFPMFKRLSRGICIRN